MEKRGKILKEVFATWKSKIFMSAPVAAGLYQFGCDQFGFPTLPKAWGMTGGALPWWGWLLIAQASFVAALFEYIRRNVPLAPHDGLPDLKVEKFQADMESLKVAFRDLTEEWGLALSAEQSSVSVHVQNVIIAPREIERLKPFGEGLERFPSPADFACDFTKTTDRFAGLFEYIYHRLGQDIEDDGVCSNNIFEEQANNLESAIRGNALNCTVNENEKDYFGSGSEKQKYLIAQARINIAKRLLGERIARLKEIEKTSERELMKVGRSLGTQPNLSQ